MTDTTVGVVFTPRSPSEQRRRRQASPSFDFGRTASSSRDVLATAAEGRPVGSLSREPFGNVVFVELDQGAGTCLPRWTSRSPSCPGVGADTVVFHGTEGAFDPKPLIEACAKRG